MRKYSFEDKIDIYKKRTNKRYAIEVFIEVLKKYDGEFTK